MSTLTSETQVSERIVIAGSGRGPVEMPVKETIKLSDTMQLALTRIPNHGSRGVSPNTMAALRRRGLIERDPKNGVAFVTVAGYHALGRKHPHE